MVLVDFDINKLEDVEISNIDMEDYPDFCDAYLSYATYEGEELTDEELAWIEENYPGFVHETIFDKQLYF